MVSTDSEHGKARSTGQEKWPDSEAKASCERTYEALSQGGLKVDTLKEQSAKHCGCNPHAYWKLCWEAEWWSLNIRYERDIRTGHNIRCDLM